MGYCMTMTQYQVTVHLQSTYGGYRGRYRIAGICPFLSSELFLELGSFLGHLDACLKRDLPENCVVVEGLATSMQVGLTARMKK